MIKYQLICKECKLTFDSWFASSKEFEKLKKKNFLSCHNCNSVDIEKSLMKPNVLNKRKSISEIPLRNNNLRLSPIPYNGGPTKMWVEFSIPTDIWNTDDPSVDGVNNMNTLPLGNLPFNNINSIGKQWIRRFALALSKETLGQIRSKFSSVPIPGEAVTLNGSALITEGKDEQNKLRDELKQTLSELTYAKMAEQDAGLLENTEKVLDKVPNYIFVG